MTPPVEYAKPANGKNQLSIATTFACPSGEGTADIVFRDTRGRAAGDRGLGGLGGRSFALAASGNTSRGDCLFAPQSVRLTPFAHVVVLIGNLFVEPGVPNRSQAAQGARSEAEELCRVISTGSPAAATSCTTGDA